MGFPLESEETPKSEGKGQRVEGKGQSEKRPGSPFFGLLPLSFVFRPFFPGRFCEGNPVGGHDRARSRRVGGSRR